MVVWLVPTTGAPERMMHWDCGFRSGNVEGALSVMFSRTAPAWPPAPSQIFLSYTTRTPIGAPTDVGETEFRLGNDRIWHGSEVSPNARVAPRITEFPAVLLDSVMSATTASLSIRALSGDAMAQIAIALPDQKGWRALVDQAVAAALADSRFSPFRPGR